MPLITPPTQTLLELVRTFVWPNLLGYQIELAANILFYRHADTRRVHKSFALVLFLILLILLGCLGFEVAATRVMFHRPLSPLTSQWNP